MSFLLTALLPAALAASPAPSTAVETGQKTAWAGFGLSTAGTTLVLVGSYAFYKGPFDAVDRYQGGRDPQKAEPTSAIASGLVVGSGMGFSAVGRPILSLGSALTARAYQAEGGAVTPTLGWVSTGAWATGVGSYFMAQSTGSSSWDWTWAGMRAASYGTGLAQLLVTRSAMQKAGGVSRKNAKPPRVQLVLGPRSGAVVGTF